MTHEDFSQAYESGVRRTIAFLISRGVVRDTALDIAQDAWLRGWQRLSHLRQDSALVSWINTIAWNHYLRGLPARQREQPLIGSPASVETVSSNPVDIERILNQCPDHERQLFEAQLLGYSTDEMAEQMGVSQTTIRVRLFRARRSVRESLGIQVGELSAAA